jgi:hypothetical protein
MPADTDGASGASNVTWSGAPECRGLSTPIVIAQGARVQRYVSACGRTCWRMAHPRILPKNGKILFLRTTRRCSWKATFRDGYKKCP